MKHFLREAVHEHTQWGMYYKSTNTSKIECFDTDSFWALIAVMSGLFMRLVGIAQ